MLKILKRKYPLKAEGEVNLLKTQLAEQIQRNEELEVAAVELAELAAAHDEALVELAGMIGG